MADKVLVRDCAIYVRKTSDEGLDMSYNSLEAHRDACTAIIAGQCHEGWVRLSIVYEDGGYYGGNMERPGLQLLLTDVADGKADIIVVYRDVNYLSAIADIGNPAGPPSCCVTKDRRNRDFRAGSAPLAVQCR